VSVAQDVSRGLHCDIAVVRGAFELQLALSVEPGEIVGVIGPNGSGKSTLLGTIAGTVAVGTGDVVLDGRSLSSAAPNQRPVSVARAHRRVGLLDQRARLFPHLDARANIAFGLRANGITRREAEAEASDWLSRVRLAGREHARAAELSGGQQQRVAIARTLAARPEVLLLDEPFAALDVTSSQELRAILVEQIRRLGMPTVIVTHDPIDLIALADRVLVLEGGRVVQEGGVTEILHAPESDFAAEFGGRSLIRGVANASGGLDVERAPIACLTGRNRLQTPGRRASASFDPSEVRLSAVSDPANVPAQNDEVARTQCSTQWIGTIAAVTSGRSGVRLTFAEWPAFTAEVPVSRAADRELQPGSRVRLTIPHDAITLTEARD